MTLNQQKITGPGPENLLKSHQLKITSEDFLIPVIISGGSGTRLWPVSRSAHPKQFCDLFKDSLQNLTIQRLATFGKPWILTGAALKIQTEIGLREIGVTAAEVIYEPMARNTAPAIGVLCHLLLKKNLGNEVVGIFPSDHLVTNEKAFLDSVQLAATCAQDKKIVTLGIRPQYPETGYGYIQGESQGTGVALSVAKFHEKPQLEKAQEFLKAGNYFWNAGIFIFHVATMAKLFEQHQPRMWKKISEIHSDQSNMAAIYPELEAISIDYAIMEKLGGTGQLMCVPTEPGWSDVGSWDAVSEEHLRSGSVKSLAEVYEESAENNFVLSQVKKTIALVGVSDLNVIDSGDVLLIVKKGESQKVKKIVDRLTAAKSPVIKDPFLEKRPWGQFEILRDTEAFKSKVIEVLPHSQISYQSHAKREEHWIITRGKGEVVLNDEVIPVKAGTHVHIPMGSKHRIRNTSDQVIQFVEVQLGTYFGEDDIVRYQDDYKRS